MHSAGHFCSFQKQSYSSQMALGSYLFHQRIKIPQEDFDLTQGTLAVEIACNALPLDMLFASGFMISSASCHGSCIPHVSALFI